MYVCCPAGVVGWMSRQGTHRRRHGTGSMLVPVMSWAEGAWPLGQAPSCRLHPFKGECPPYFTLAH